ncbi:MAG: hypothetical protein ACYSUG_04965 [Planctomycetota bacterium]|jgi:hypothetical protein
MPVFNYQALDANGNEKKGTIEALNSKEAISLIRNQGLFPTKVRPAPNQQPLPAEDSIEPEEKTSPSSEGSFKFPDGAKCKLKRSMETLPGQMNIWGEQGKTSLVFKSCPDDFKAQETVSIDIDDIRDVRKKGFFRKTLIVKTSSGEEYMFIGNIGRIAEILKFESTYRNKTN